MVVEGVAGFAEVREFSGHGHGDAILLKGFELVEFLEERPFPAADHL